MNSKVIVGILIAFIAISFLTIGRNPLLNDDAALYALCAKNAIVHNMWLAQLITPGDPTSFLDKPPVGIWMLAWLPKIVGLNELTIHLPNLLYYSLILWLIYSFVSRQGGKKTALYSTMIAATSLALVVYSRTPKLDVPLTLWLVIAHLLLFDWLKNDQIKSLYLFCAAIAVAFLVKSGFGLFVPALTIMGLFVLSSEIRSKMVKTLFSFQSIICLFIITVIIGSIIALQSIPLQEQWLPYLKSITIQSKYNTSYVGFGFHHDILGVLLITLFPWMPLFFASLKTKLWQRPLTLQSFALIWFWTNFLFLLFCYRQTDFRTMTIFVPPMAILAGCQLNEKPKLATALWNIFYIIVFSLIFFVGLTRGTNQDGFSITAALIPLGLFLISLVGLQWFFQRPSEKRFTLVLTLILLSYSFLFYNTKPIADAFNPDVSWPGMIKQHRAQGYKFYIYRPRDRKMIYSPDLFYVDFLAGPADQYFWEGKELNQRLSKGKALVLSDTASLKKHQIKKGKVLAEDNYSSLVIIP